MSAFAQRHRLAAGAAVRFGELALKEHRVSCRAGEHIDLRRSRFSEKLLRNQRLWSQIPAPGLIDSQLSGEVREDGVARLQAINRAKHIKRKRL
jgi:hypothetical protein